MKKNILVIGGGAAGFFAAIACAEANGNRVTILEKSAQLLAKVKVSGGGRCNVTHACFEPKQLVKFYPRGEKQLLGPFTRFNPANVIDWFANRGVELKTEDDGRMFPVTDSSQTIINCLQNEAEKRGVNIRLQTGARRLTLTPQGSWVIETNTGEQIAADAVIVATGSSQSVWKMLENEGVKIIPPVPSLFTFNIQDERIKGLEGLSVPNATVSIVRLSNAAVSPPPCTGALLITHWGMSGPGILRLSAWGARVLEAVKYQFEIEVNWTGELSPKEVQEQIRKFKQEYAKKNVAGNALFGFPRRLWERFCMATGVKANYADLSNKQIEQLQQQITCGRFKVSGKSTFKEEFVTAGGVDLDEVDFKTMQCKKLPGLYFAGEVLDIDAITGGFNFQAAWTTGWIAGNSV